MQTNQIPSQLLIFFKKEVLQILKTFFRQIFENFLTFSLKDLSIASERIKAINNNEKIGVYGDYDVDGTTSCALLFHF